MAFGGYSYNTFDPKSIKDFGGYRNGGQDRTTGKRVKSVFKTDQVIHIWAQRTQTFGKNGKGNVFFEGDRLFDYGHHFCLGQFVTNAAGELAVLLNADSYGPTTSEHQGQTARAVPHGIPTFTIPKAGYESYSNNLDLEKSIQQYADRATDYAGKAKRARKEWSKDTFTARAASLVKEAKDFAEFFGIPAPEMNLDSLVIAAEESRKRVAAETKRREQEARQRSTAAFAEWQSGERDQCPYEWQRDEHGGVRMRIRGDILETAQGAEVPLAHAVKAFRFLKRCKERGEAWERNGHTIRVGHFVIDKIEPNGNFRAGCHYFTWEQVAIAAKAAGVFDLTPADTREKTA